VDASLGEERPGGLLQMETCAAPPRDRRLQKARKGVPARDWLMSLLEIGAKRFDRVERFLGHLLARDETIDAAKITAKRC
jgi:hypothetical protein